MSSSPRIAWVDIYKALAITLVVVGHTASPFGALIYSFHMAAFFFIAGYTTHLEKYTFAGYLGRRARTLLIPFVCINLLFIFYALAVGATRVGPHVLPFQPSIDWAQIAMQQLFLQALVPVDLAGATWFLIVLFSASILAKLLFEATRRLGLREWWVWLPILSGVACVLKDISPQNPWPLQLDVSLMALFFFYLGISFRRHLVFEQQIRHTYALPIALITLWYVSSYYWLRVDFTGRFFPAFPALVLVSLSGIYVLYLASIGLTRLPMGTDTLIRVGRQTLAILAFHFLGFKLAFLLLVATHRAPLSQLKELVPKDTTTAYWPLIALISLSFCLLLAALVRLNPWSNLLLLGQDDPRVREVVRHATLRAD